MHLLLHFVNLDKKKAFLDIQIYQSQKWKYADVEISGEMFNIP